ncbi:MULTISPECIES: CynX/NimT family MFS transporter [Bacillaceae]|uniref:CynX/NimT family MFS transporter n=1 Tax=Bacillaceae TaxID=186817 RepID=UPI001E6262A0|nr:MULTISPECIES: MFS transporter [Bacillaceae]MCE4048722.1 MFS transporter [Bacillus sp. Au-Bac7]MCM3032856.1 MFS transporter [Niallia sp. MER 6]
MDLSKSSDYNKSISIYLLIAGIVLVAFNLRPAITSLGPLVGFIQEDVGLAHWSSGLLMSLPLITFSVMSPLVPKISSRLSNEKTLLLGLIILLTGICSRSIPYTFFLFAGTLLVGIGIAIGNVLLPAIVKDKFPEKFGLMTSVYSTSMGVFASLASGLSVPLADGQGLGWQGAQMVWGIPAVAAIIVWFYLLKYNREDKEVITGAKPVSTKVWSSPIAWQIAVFMGFQSFLFYVTISWLPEILHSYGMSLETAGWMLSFTQLVGLPASFFIPFIASRLRSQSLIACGLGICAILGYSGLLFSADHYPILIISIILIGLALGGIFPLALSLIGFRSQNAKQAAELSGMAQSTGYILAAVGPLFIGSLFDWTHVWSIPIVLLIIIAGIVTIFGILSGRDRHI